MHPTNCKLLHSTSFKHLVTSRPWLSSSGTFPPFSPTSGTTSLSLGMQSPSRSHGRRFRNFCIYRFGNSHNHLHHFGFSHHQHLGSSRNCNNSAIFGAALSPEAAARPCGLHFASFHALIIGSPGSPHPTWQYAFTSYNGSFLDIHHPSIPSQQAPLT